MDWFFAEYLRQLLAQRDWTANKLADKSGMSHSFIGTLLRGGRSNDKHPPRISVDTLLDLARALKEPEGKLLLAYQGIAPDNREGNLEFVTEVMLAALRAGAEWQDLTQIQQKQLLETVARLTRKFIDMTVDHEIKRLQR